MNLETEIDRNLWQAIRRSYESQAWTNAIQDSIYYLSDVVRTKTGLQSDGTALAGQAFGGRSPKLQINRLLSESDKNVQAGAEQLFRGLYQAIRNPRSHERVEDNQKDADALIIFVDYLLRLIGHAKATFSIDEMLRRVTDESFVAGARYSELLVSEIPTHLRGQTAISIYQAKKSGDGRKLKFFFDALLPRLSDNENVDFFEAVSDELRDSNDEESLRILLQLLDPDYWPRITEAARLRTENRIVQNLRAGRFSQAASKCFAGAMSTYSRSFWKQFSLQGELLVAICQKLDSQSPESQDFVFEYIFWWMDYLASEPPRRLKRLVIDALTAGDIRYYRAMSGYDGYSCWNREAWGDEVNKAYDEFVEQDVTANEQDVPF